MNPDIVGWAASAVLLCTLVRQIVVQAKDPDAAGVSRWLFVGQITASVLFVAYSALLGNRVFIATNALILLTAVAGQWIVSRKRR